MNYFITGLGRSGTTWLAGILDSPKSWTCAHEEVDERSKVIPHPFSPFPLGRFEEAGRNYGECHGMLRYHLSADCIGPEMRVPRRVYLRRDPLDLVASWMHATRAPYELSATCFEIFWHAANLDKWARRSGSKVLDVEQLWASSEQVTSLAKWLGVPVTVTREMMPPVNATPEADRKFEWTPHHLEVARRVASRVGFGAVVERATAKKLNPVGSLT